jgi:hypothetical protein
MMWRKVALADFPVYDRMPCGLSEAKVDQRIFCAFRAVAVEEEG